MRGPLSSQIPSKYTAQTQGASAFSCGSHAQLPGGLGWRGGELEEKDLNKPLSLASFPPGGLDTKRLSLHSLRLLIGFGAPELPSLQFLCKIFLFMLQQCDSAPYARESDPAERLPCRGCNPPGEELTTTGFSKLWGGHVSQFPGGRKRNPRHLLFGP